MPLTIFHYSPAHCFYPQFGLGPPYKLIITNSYAFRPLRIALIQAFLQNRFYTATMICRKLIHIVRAEQSGQFLPVYQRIPLFWILDFIVAAKLPFTGMTHNTGSNHIEIYMPGSQLNGCGTLPRLHGIGLPRKLLCGSSFDYIPYRFFRRSIESNPE
jgi:hypothetical protein